VSVTNCTAMQLLARQIIKRRPGWLIVTCIRKVVHLSGEW
jgi:hypothetical protein